MAGPFGLTFAPTDDAAAEARGAQPGRRQQAAVKVLNLLPPAQYGPSSFAPNALMQAPGGGMGSADPNKAVIASILRTLVGSDGGGMDPSRPAELASAGAFSRPGAPRIHDEGHERLPGDPGIQVPQPDPTGDPATDGPFTRTGGSGVGLPRRPPWRTQGGQGF